MTPAAYWNQGVANVPHMTGAATLMDGADIREHAEKLGFTLPFDNLLDVGCGTGRLAAFARVYYCGVDIAADAIAYCHAHGIGTAYLNDRGAQLIDGPDDLRVSPGAIGMPFDWITCLSVFTHIPRHERIAYLQAFATTRADNLLVDIIPGDGKGDVSLWTAERDRFEFDLQESGWRVCGSYERTCPSGPVHRYYRCERSR